MTEGTQRRLAAIVSVDVVGYSRLMGRDEIGTLATLRAHRAELIDPLIKKHGGRIVKTMGDGLLLEFPSVVAAVECVIATQTGMVERNDGISKELSVRFRVGVHLGDVIVEGEDIFGDGVNVAARLEGLAEENGLALSDDAYRQVRDRLDVEWRDSGEHEVKNIVRPIQVWHWAPAVSRQAPQSPDANERPLPADKPSIVVLPFENMSRDPEHEFFADGIAEDFITALSKISRMRVIARNSTLAYKEGARDLRRISSELSVRYVLEGSIRSGGNRLRISAQLIDAVDGNHIWAERFDRTVDDLFDIQDEITKEIVTALRVNLTDGEEALILARGTNSIEAWQLCVRATELFMRFSFTDFLEARSMAEKAVAIDPDYAYAWATLGFTHWWDGRLGYTGESEAKFLRAQEFAERAMALDDTVSWVIGLSTMVAGNLGRHDEGVAMARRGFELYPGSADVRAFLAFALSLAGKYDEAVDHFHAAMALNPFYPNWYRNGLARTLIVLEDFDKALAICNEILTTEPAFLQALLQKAYIFVQTGCLIEAQKTVGEVRLIAPNLHLSDAHGLQRNSDDAFMQRFMDSLREAGLPV